MSKLQQTLLPIKLEESGERLTRLGGLVLVEELARAKGVWESVDELIGKPGSGRGYAASVFVRPLVWMLHAGGRRIEDLRELGSEQEVLSKLGMEVLPSTDAVGDWLRRHGGAGLGIESIKLVNRRVIQRTLRNEPEEVTLDVDASIVESEKREAEWTYRSVRGYQPMLGYVNELCVPARISGGERICGSASG